MKATQTDDPRDLIHRARRGDQEAFGALYEQFFVPVFRYIYYRVGKKEDAEDLVQTVFVKAYESLPSFRQTSSPPLAYFFTIARNTIIDHARKKKDVVMHTIEELLESVPSLEASPHEKALQSESVAFMRCALDELEGDQKDVIILKFINDLSNKEIAALMDRSEAAVRQLQHRALSSLRSIIKKRSGLSSP